MTATQPPLTPEQCRHAREVLGWSQEELAAQAATSTQTVGYFERGDKRTRPATQAALRRALEDAGIEFLPGGTVRLCVGSATAAGS